MMAKRKATRKKAARTARKEAKTKVSTQKQAKKTRKLTSATGKTSKRKTTPKKAVMGKKSQKTAKGTTDRKAARKKIVKKATPKKMPAKAAQRKAANTKVTTKKTADTAAKKKASKKKAAVRTTEPKAPAAKRQPQEPGLPLKEVRARLGLIGPQIADLDWLEGLYLYGRALLEVPRLERVGFIVVYRGRRGAKRLKAAESELRTLLEAVLPLDFELNTGTLEVGRLLSEGNPAAMAHLGYAEPVFTRAV